MVGEQDVGEFGELSGFQWEQVKWRRFDRQSIIWFESFEVKTAAMGAFFKLLYPVELRGVSVSTDFLHYSISIVYYSP